MSTLEQTTKFIEQFQVIIYPMLIAGYALGYKLYKELKNKKAEIDKEDNSRNRARSWERYNQWEHEEALSILSKIRELCNYYKDLGAMDLVSYIQLENGTTANSKLCNMYVSCVAEDNRYGRLRKQINLLQRIPCSTILDWILSVQSGKFQFSDIDEIVEQNTKESFIIQNIGSSIAVGAYDPDGYFIGACVFDYADKAYNNQDLEQQMELIGQFKVGIQTVFLNYHMARTKKKHSLGILGSS